MKKVHLLFKNLRKQNRQKNGIQKWNHEPVVDGAVML